MTAWWLSDDCLTTAWWLPNIYNWHMTVCWQPDLISWRIHDCKMIFWWLCDDCVMTVWWLSDDCLMNVWWLSDDCLMNFWWLPVDFLVTSWWLHDDCLVTTWWLPGDYLVTSWQPDDCQMTVWWLSDVWYWLKLAMKFKIPFMQHFYLIFLHCVFAERPAIWCSQTPASTELETRTRFNEHFRNVFYRSFIFGLNMTLF